eukprot:5746329-Prymnesium_polylepis.1
MQERRCTGLSSHKRASLVFAVVRGPLRLHRPARAAPAPALHRPQQGTDRQVPRLRAGAPTKRPPPRRAHPSLDSSRALTSALTSAATRGLSPTPRLRRQPLVQLPIDPGVAPPALRAHSLTMSRSCACCAACGR